jgi:tRNA modification GTPase
VSSPGPAFALLTPPGEGGISVFALRGARAAELLAGAFRVRRPPTDATGGEILYGFLDDGSGATVDEVIVAVLDGSGESLEIGSHGGVVAAHEVAARLRELGFEELDPGRLAARLVAEGESDPLAEATLSALARARTREQLRFVTAASGRLRAAISRAMALPDAGLAPALERMLVGAGAAQLAAAGARVAIVGPTNSGKSTLANALAGTDRVIVSAEPHTTRDVVKLDAQIDGLAVRLADTAGALFESDDLGSEGWARALAAAAAADLTLLVLDGSREETELDRRCADALASEGIRHLTVLNKRDLGIAGRDAADVTCIPVSALSGEGLAELAGTIRAELMGAGGDPGDAFDKVVAERLSSCLGAARAGRPDGARRALAELVAAAPPAETT